MDTEFHTAPRLSPNPGSQTWVPDHPCMRALFGAPRQQPLTGLPHCGPFGPPAAMQSFLSRSATAHASLPLPFTHTTTMTH